MRKKIYFYTSDKFADYIKEQCKNMSNTHGIDLSTADMSSLLLKKVIEPNNINLVDTIKPLDLNLKWKKLKIKL